MESRVDPRSESGLPLAQRIESIAAVAEGIAHDLMSVLASISMSLELLAPKLAPEDSWLAECLTDGVHRGREGVRQIYWLASAKPGLPLYYDPLHLLKDARRLMAQAYPQIEVSSEYPPEVGLVYGEPALLRQLLIGVAVEACSRAGENGRLVLRARSSEGAGSVTAEEGKARVRFEVAVASAPPFPVVEAHGWRTRPPMAALLQEFAAQGGTFAEVEDSPGTLFIGFELPLAEPRPELEAGAPARREGGGETR